MQKLFLGFTALCLLGGGVAVANYAVTIGSGTNFGSVLVGGTVHYAQQLICDYVTPAQCVHVSAPGALQVDGSAVTQPISGSLTNISGTISLPTGAATVAAQTTGNTSLGTIATNSGTQATAALQTTGNTSLSTIATNTTGAATSALQSTGNTTLSTIATNTGSQIPAGVNYIGHTSLDPCAYQTKVNVPVSYATTALTQQIAASGATAIYICSLSLISSVASSFSITGGTGTNCGTGTAAIIGGTTAAAGLSLAANGGLTMGSGSGSVAATAASSALCITQSGAGTLAGNIVYVQQ